MNNPSDPVPQLFEQRGPRHMNTASVEFRPYSLERFPVIGSAVDKYPSLVFKSSTHAMTPTRAAVLVYTSDDLYLGRLAIDWDTMRLGTIKDGENGIVYGWLSDVASEHPSLDLTDIAK